MPTLYVLVGLPGAGKTTYAREHLPKAIRICHDDLVKMTTGQWDVTKTALYHTMEWILTKTALEHNQDVVIDRTNLDRKTRGRFLNAAHFAEVLEPILKIAVVFNVPPEVAKERNRSSERQAAGAMVPDEAYDKLATRFEAVNLLEGFDQIINV